MNQTDCGVVRELLPDYASRRLDGDGVAVVDGHLAHCSECRSEHELANMLFATRASVPADLAERIVAAVRRDRRPASRPWWGISAAAVAALALGVGLSQNVTPATQPLPEFAAEYEEGDLWSSDDGLVAGAPAIESLSDEALEELLQELDASLGGAA